MFRVRLEMDSKFRVPVPPRNEILEIWLEMDSKFRVPVPPRNEILEIWLEMCSKIPTMTFNLESSCRSYTFRQGVVPAPAHSSQIRTFHSLTEAWLPAPWVEAAGVTEDFYTPALCLV